ncbi:MAG TPA: hypothetical protein VMX14_04630 [Anaerolineae bacterium]|nr:hypothetical protein [Anaerolineae bacterium]
MLQAAVPSVQIIRAVLREYHAATHTAEVEPVLGPASLVGEIPVLMSCRPDLLTTGREVAVLTWPDVDGLVLGPYGAVPDDPPNAGDADTVDGIHASPTATANKLLALNASSKLPASITGDADTVDSIHAAASATANKLLALDASSKLPASITGDADTVDSIHAATTPTASKLLAMNANAKFPTHTIEGSLTVETGLNVGDSIEGTTSSTANYHVTKVARKAPAANTFADLMVFTCPSAPANSIYRSLCNGFLLVSVTGRTNGGSYCAISRVYLVTVTQFAATALITAIQQIGVDNASGIGGTLTVSQKAGATSTSVTIQGKVTFADFSSCVLGAHFVDFSIATSDVCLLTPAAA